MAETVWVLIIQAEIYRQVHVCSCHESAFALLYEYVSEQWEGAFGDQPMPEDTRQAVRDYFDDAAESYYLQEHQVVEGVGCAPSDNRD